MESLGVVRSERRRWWRWGESVAGAAAVLLQAKPLLELRSYSSYSSSDSSSDSDGLTDMRVVNRVAVPLSASNADVPFFLRRARRELDGQFRDVCRAVAVPNAGNHRTASACNR